MRWGWHFSESFGLAWARWANKGRAARSSGHGSGAGIKYCEGFDLVFTNERPAVEQPGETGLRDLPFREGRLILEVLQEMRAGNPVRPPQQLLRRELPARFHHDQIQLVQSEQDTVRLDGGKGEPGLPAPRWGHPCAELLRLFLSEAVAAGDRGVLLLEAQISDTQSGLAVQAVSGEGWVPIAPGTEGAWSGAGSRYTIAPCTDTSIEAPSVP